MPLPRCVKCSNPIRQAGRRGVGEWLDYGNGFGQHITCPPPPDWPRVWPTEADMQAGMPGQVRGLLPPTLED